MDDFRGWAGVEELEVDDTGHWLKADVVDVLHARWVCRRMQVSAMSQANSSVVSALAKAEVCVMSGSRESFGPVVPSSCLPTSVLAG